MTMAKRWWVAACVVATVLAGCSGDRELTCAAAERYARAGSAPPVRIPDGLTPPDESDSLRVPTESVAPERSASERCLEVPPDFNTRAPPSTAERPAAEPPRNPEREIDN